MNAPVTDRTWKPRIFAGTSFSRDEIRIATESLSKQLLALQFAASWLMEAFEKENLVSIKCAAESVRARSADVERTAGQIKALSGSLAETFLAHINRNPHT